MSTESRPKILIVDDNPNNLRAYEVTLEPLNLEIKKAISGQKALEVAHCHDFFLILMDVQMPDMDGFETASLILDHPKTSHIPIIFITAFAQDEAFEFKGYESGAVDYMVKPVNEDILRSKVRVFLEMHEQKKLLRTTLEELKRTNEELRVYDYMVSHDLKAPLRNIKSFIELIEKDIGDKLDGETLVFFKLIVQCSNQANELIKSLLAFAEADKSRDLKEAISLEKCIKGAITNLDAVIKEKSVSIVLENLPVSVHGVPIKIQQLFQNLLGNSMTYQKPENRPEIRIYGEFGEDLLNIIVEDNGIGFSQKRTKEIFEPFTRLHGKGQYDGSGIGLAICKKIVDFHDWKISAIGEEGKGSRFIISIPVSDTLKREFCRRQYS